MSRFDGDIALDTGRDLLSGMLRVHKKAIENYKADPNSRGKQILEATSRGLEVVEDGLMTLLIPGYIPSYDPTNETEGI